ncbi:CocE/NonD family hydrolase [Herbiconiux moechotypicola]|uniref:CocE/NonD family hydrolase n=1 Tax=Herbiconiux moechotypicola TaxID=637393 RepID=A0ABP5QSW9_9MICO|nr:CocE/NonD family hydrolase [Herbiconiux moechotypicola]MCS5730778.1 CocE/NonD family hydrolase [Herbiconiux moechotypicola]
MTVFRRAATATVALVVIAGAFSATPAMAASVTTTAPATPASVASVADGTTHAENPSVPEGAAWTEHYFPSPVASSNGDPVTLHADVLRPEGLAADAQTPVIMSIGPYFSHSGMNEDTHPKHTGPSARFTDLIEGAGLMERGYTFVYVDLRGFGGSTGCIDWQGPGEQADVVAAVEWAAQQSWSTGAVGLYGKSYDASTGLIGINEQPEGLKAVVAQEPSWSGYDYLVTNDVPRPQQVASPQAYLDIANLPGVDRSYQKDGYDIAPDTDTYLTNAAYEKTHPECATTLMSETKETDRTSAFWSVRDLPANVGGSSIPLVFTQGLTEQNTKPESMQEYLDNHTGEVRSWLGPWDHVRGNERDGDGVLQMGRSTWFDEVIDFYDDHLVSKTTELDSYAYIQDNFGHWRAQDAWGTATKDVSVALRPGSYLDTGRGTVTDPDPGTPEPSPNPLLVLADDATDPDSTDPGAAEDEGPLTNDQALGNLTISAPVRTEVRLTGTPTVELHTEGTGNVAVQLWDVAPDRTAVTINSSVSKLSADGVTSFGLLGMDWTLAPGHALGVTFDSIDWGFWVPQPSGERVTVTSGTVSLAVEPTTADVPADGGRAPYLDEYIQHNTWDDPMPAAPATFVLSAATGSLASASDASSVTAGTAVEVTGAGYDPGAPVALSASFAGGAPETVTTDADGTFRASVTVPSETAPGAATLTATAEDGGTSSVQVIVVAAEVPTPSPTPTPSTSPASDAGTQPAALAATGAAAGPLALGAGAAALALLAGAGLVLLRRRAASRQ